MELSCWVTFLLFIATASPTLTLAHGVHPYITPREAILAPMGVNETVKARCEVPEGEVPRWIVKEHLLFNSSGIFIHTIDNVSDIYFTDPGLDEFRNVSGSTALTLECHAFVPDNFDVHNESDWRLILRFEAPGRPGPISVSGSTIWWRAPMNMIEGVPLTYAVLIVDSANGAIIYNQTLEERRIPVDLPKCYNITVWAANKAGIGEPSFRHSCKPVDPTDIYSPSPPTHLSPSTHQTPPTTPSSASAGTSVATGIIVLLHLLYTLTCT